MEKQLRICVVTYNWPPRNAIGAHRPYSWAKRWASLGHTVVVITARKKFYDEPLDLELPELRDVEVVEVPYGRSRPDNPGSSGWLIPGRHVSKILKIGKHALARYLGVRLDPRDRWVSAALETGTSMAEGCDAIVSSFGPRACHLLAAKIKRACPGLVWIADYRDPWSQNHLENFTRWSRDRECRLEVNTVGSLADAVVTVSSEWARQLEALLKVPVHVVPNGFEFDEGELSAAIKRYTCRPKSRSLVLVHTGLIYPGRRDPTPLLNAVRQLQQEGRIAPNDIAVEFYGARPGDLEQVVKATNSEDFVRLRGHVPREVALRAQRDADALVLLESGQEDAVGVIPGKLYEYLSAGVPVVGIGCGPNSSVGVLLDQTGAGRAFGLDVAALKAALLEIRSCEGISWYTPRQTRILQYSRSLQAERMLDVIQSARQSA